MNDYIISVLNQFERLLKEINDFNTRASFKRIDSGLQVIIPTPYKKEDIDIFVLNANDKTFFVTHLLPISEDNSFDSTEAVYTIKSVLNKCSEYLIKTQPKYKKPVITSEMTSSKRVDVIFGTAITSNLDWDTHALLEAFVHVYSLIYMFYGQLESLDNENIPQKHDSNQGCYIATAVYGSYDCPQVWTLRRYRDYTLAETWHGRAFIKTYYAISPTLVKWFGHTEWFKKMWQGKLDRMVAKLQTNGVESTPYEDKEW
ncbi:MAG: hypothetical protein E7531_02415 [Ruminococcaceae bacterium]|nr:hypothetical protein [Oscillospiraceae bacterium]